MDLGLTGRVALVTGGGRGIGLADAERLAAEGASIAINDIDVVAADRAVESLRARGTEAIAVGGDAADECVARDGVATVVARFGRLDVLVNNAGIGVPQRRPAEAMPADEWDAMIRTHLRSTFLWSGAAVPAMRANGYGRIVNMCSMNFTGGGRPGVSHYSAAKAGILGFTRTLAKEVGRDGITANAIAPGYVETDLIASFTPEMREVLRRQNPVGRTCRPEEVAALVAYLASTHAGFVNGELVCMDGGRRDYWWGDA
ncbi:MAG TPA: SDR family NAD(P)-dependent oxidoreductase [Casimicrobiaceae bacterium]|nr:SDR family NAD(P)-dependent oxidoreductase [Casimicrobiaceae bacterium]